MPHGHTRIASRGACIYCAAHGVDLTDEHVVPFSLGGAHILEDASCRRCAAITTKFERDVAKDMWGDARISYKVPSRRKKKRKIHIVLADPADRSRRVKVPYSEYPAPMLFYKMSRAGLLEGLPDTVDLSSAWQMVAVHDDVKAKGFQQKFGVPLTAKIRHMPESFARLLAKIGYCNLLTILDPGDFRPICLPYILGERKNPSYVVGGALEIAESEAVGYRLDVVGFGSAERMMLVTEIRLFANVGTPTYHVVVGDVIGNEKVAAMLTKAEGMITVEPVTWPAASGDKSDHWMPRVWPLPFWGK
jgi:HNH endonuclease